MIIIFNVKFDFNNNKLNDREKMEFINLLEFTINNILNISNIELMENCEITFTEDFKEEVEEFQKQYGLSIGYTDNNKDETCGIALDYIYNDKLHVNIFINKKILFGLKIEDEFEGTTLQKFCINAIHHELMHAYDMLQSYDMYESMLSCKQDDALERHLNSISLMIWKEYFADRMASKTFEGDYFKILYEKICYCQNRIRAIIEVNKQFGNIEKMYKDISKIIIISLRFTAYRLGKLYNEGEIKKVQEKVEKENDKLNSSFIGTIYMELFVELDNLFNNYLKWDINKFENLNSSIKKLYNFFGISLSSSEDGEEIIISLLSSF